MLDIHDSYIVSYTRNFKDESLIMGVESDTGVSGKVVFEKVLVNFFEKEVMNAGIGGIIYGIEEENANEFFNNQDIEQIFTESKKFIFPINIDSYKQLIDFVTKKNQYNIYYVDSSYGMNGWIICERFSIVED